MEYIEELKMLANNLQNEVANGGEKFVAISSMAGMGKTSLSLMLAGESYHLFSNEINASDVKSICSRLGIPLPKRLISGNLSNLMNAIEHLSGMNETIVVDDVGLFGPLELFGNMLEALNKSDLKVIFTVQKSMRMSTEQIYEERNSIFIKSLKQFVGTFSIVDLSKGADGSVNANVHRWVGGEEVKDGN
jgi:hypothetical protein